MSKFPKALRTRYSHPSLALASENNTVMGNRVLRENAAGCFDMEDEWVGVNKDHIRRPAKIAPWTAAPYVTVCVIRVDALQ